MEWGRWERRGKCGLDGLVFAGEVVSYEIVDKLGEHGGVAGGPDAVVFVDDCGGGIIGETMLVMMIPGEDHRRKKKEENGKEEHDEGSLIARTNT